MGFWRKCRITFRWLRIAVWVLVLAVIGAFLWCNRVGLPDFVKARLVAALREQGVELEFSRMRLSLVRGLVADDVRAGEPDKTNGAAFSARLVQLDVDFAALLRRRLELDGLVLRDAVFTLPLSPTNALALTNLQASLRFGTNDTWTLDQLHADFAGAQINIGGELMHARETAHWEFFTGGAGGGHGAAGASLKDFADVLGKIRFQGVPQLRLKISGDAHDVHSVAIRLDVAADGVRAPWFAAKDFQFTADLTAPAAAPTNSDATLGFWKDLQPFQLVWSAKLGELHTEKLVAGSVACAGRWAAPVLTVSNLSARLGGGDVRVGATLDVLTRRTEFTLAAGLNLQLAGKFLDKDLQNILAKISAPQIPALKAEGSLQLPSWTNFVVSADDILDSLRVSGELAATNFSIAGVKLDRLRTQMHFGDLMFELTEFTAAQGKTELHLNGHLSAATHNFGATLSGGLDAATLAPLFTGTGATNVLNNLMFNAPLQLKLEARGNLRSVQTLTATGQLALAHFAVRGQAVDQLTASLTYSNLTAELLRPHLVRAGGAQEFNADKLTLDIAGQKLFFVNGLAHVEPLAVARAIGPKTAAGMEPFQFLAVPTVHVSGCVPLRQENDEIVTDDADMWFEMEGTVPFRWLKFETPTIHGTIRWWKDYLILTNATTECYGGTAQGYGSFYLETPGDGTDFNAFMTATNVDFHRMGQALWSPTNQLEGSLSGTLLISKANSADWRTWNGSGDAKLHDGLLWDVPVFAFMSQILNGITPGLGNSRATEAAGKFILTNGVVFTDSLVIQAQSMRLEYNGTVDLDCNVNARVTARIFRNMPLIGPLVSVLFTPLSKVTECHVAGTLGEPKITPVYIPGFIPKVLSVPLHPFRTVEDIFSSPATNSASTNTPSAGK